MENTTNPEPDKTIPKIKFHIDFEDDLKYTLQRLTYNDPAGLEFRLKNSGMDTNQIKKVVEANSPDKKHNLLENYFRKYYIEHQQQMEVVGSTYQSIWDQKTDNFFIEVNKACAPYKWRFPEYKFLVTAFYSRASWGVSNELAVKWSRDPKEYYFLNAFELLLAHLFEAVDQKYESRPVEDWKLWAIAESTAYILTYKKGLINKSINDSLVEPSSFSYPQLIKPIEDLSKIFNKRNNFGDYLEKSVEYIKKYSVEELKNAPK